MAARVTGFVTVSEVQGGTRIVKVREWRCYSEPSETYFQFRRPATTSRATVKSVADQLSGRIEAVLGLGEVTDVVYSQDVTPGGNLQDVMTTYWTTPDGSESGFVESPLANFGPSYTGNQIANDQAS